MFESLSRGEWRTVADSVAGDVHHSFAGDHPLGGERHDRDGMRRWFERLFRLFPALDFEIVEVISSGWPWRTEVAVEWRAWVTPAEGPGYRNTGTHRVTIVWGRATRVTAYEDSQAVAEACRRMAVGGIEEAAAPPIVGWS